MKKIILITILFFGIASMAYSQVSPRLSIAPAKFELEVTPGETIEDFVGIINRSDVAIPIKARVLNFTAEDRTGVIQFYSQTPPGGARGSTPDTDDTSYNPIKWIKLKNPNFILDPGEEEDLKFSVEIPGNAEPGGHYAVILFEPQMPPYYFEEQASRVIPQIGALLIFTVEVEDMERAEEPFSIASFQLPEYDRMEGLENLMDGARGLVIPGAKAQETLQIIGKTAFSFILGITNNDIVHSRPEGLITIFGFRGNKIEEIEVQPQTILPGKVREFEIAFDPSEVQRFGILPEFISRHMFLGSYSAVVQLRVSEGFSASRVFTFWIFPWKELLALFVFLIALFILRKRIRGAIKILAIGAPRRILRRNAKFKTKNGQPQI